jgi:hypothetical protein
LIAISQALAAERKRWFYTSSIAWRACAPKRSGCACIQGLTAGTTA